MGSFLPAPGLFLLFCCGSLSKENFFAFFAEKTHPYVVSLTRLLYDKEEIMEHDCKHLENRISCQGNGQLEVHNIPTGSNSADTEEDIIVYSPAQLSSMLSISMHGAYDLMKQEGFPSFRIGRKLMVTIDDFYDWLSRQKQQSIS